MSSLSFIVPTQYGAFEPYSGPQFEHSGHMMNNYQPPAPPHHSQHQSPHQQPLPPASSAPQQSYSQTYTSSPHMLGSSPNLNAQRRSSEQPAMQPYPSRQVSQSPYEQPPQSVRGSPASIGFAHSSPEPQHMPPAPTRSASYPNTSYTHHQGLPAPSGTPLAYSATFPSPQPHYGSHNYDVGYQGGMYSHHSSGYGSPYLTSSGPDAGGIGAGTLMPGQHPPHTAPGGPTPDQGGHVRILNTRPKPQCWEHGCNGRQFSTFSNLLRHQREKSGTASKSVCPRCGAEFTRTTARNGHMENDKCKPRRASATGSDK